VSPLNRKPGISEALPSEEVLRSLNINILHESLSQFGITEVSPEVGYQFSNLYFVTDYSYYIADSLQAEVLKHEARNV